MTLRDLGPGPESPGTDGRPCGPSDPSAIRQGERVEIAGTGTRARSPGISGGSRGPWDTAPVARTNGLASGPSDPGPSRPGELVDPVGPAKPAGVARDRWWTTRALGHWPRLPWTAGGPPRHSERGGSPQDKESTPWTLRPERESPGSVGGYRSPSDPSPSRLGHLVDPTCYRSRARAAKDIWSKPGPGHPDYLGIPLDLGHGPGRPD